jgi:hypothetical protein
MANDRAAVKHILRFEVKNLDDTREVSAVVDEIAKLTPDIAERLSTADDTIQLHVRREEAIPIDPITIVIIVELINITAKPLVEGFFKRIGEKMADWLMDDIDNAMVTPKDNEPEEHEETQQHEEPPR